MRALICGPSKKDREQLAAKTLDNVTVIAPKPDDYDEALYAREPWLDVEVERRTCGAAPARSSGAPSDSREAGTAVVRPAMLALDIHSFRNITTI